MNELLSAGIHGLSAHDSGLLALRTSVGVFFAISGYHKLFYKERHEAMVKTLAKDRVPFLKFNEWFVPVVEFVAGITLALGLLSVLSAALLLVICCVAFCVDGWRRIWEEYRPINKADALDDVLYLPEVLYAIMLVAVILGGPGEFSLDHHFFKGAFK